MEKRLKDAQKEMGYIGTVEMISTDNISNWEYRDRKNLNWEI